MSGPEPQFPYLIPFPRSFWTIQIIYCRRFLLWKGTVYYFSFIYHLFKVTFFRKKLNRGNNLENLNAVFSSSLESDISQANKLPPILYQRRRALIQKLIRNFPEAATWGILQNKGFLKFCRFRRETSVLESLFKTLEVLVLIKKRLPHRCFPGKICEIFKNTYFEEHLRPTPSGFHFKKLWSTRLKFLEFFKQRENYRNILQELVIK